MTDRSLIVVALGGNAISRPNEEGTVAQQFTNSRETAKALADLIQSGHQLVITHGNGPQIGNFLLRNEAASGTIYPLPMEVAVAHVQGGMGFMIAQTLTNECHARGDERIVATFVTTVTVDVRDPSFARPTKPVGRTLTADEVDRHRNEGWQVCKVGPGTYRRVVPSPRPDHIMEIETIRRSVNAGDIIVACGGGGIPVVRNPDRGLEGVAAVIDKDLVSALLACELRAPSMMILTNVDRVSVDFGTPQERPINRMTLAEARRHFDDGQFPPGSMGPKIQGAIDFLENNACDDPQVVIGPLHRAVDAMAGRTGTRITRS